MFFTGWPLAANRLPQRDCASVPGPLFFIYVVRITIPLSHCGGAAKQACRLSAADHSLLPVSSVYQLERPPPRPNFLNTLEQHTLEAAQSLARGLHARCRRLKQYEEFHNDDIDRRAASDWSTGLWGAGLYRRQDRPASTAASGLRCSSHTRTRI
jgi:hypothetical protein